MSPECPNCGETERIERDRALGGNVCGECGVVFSGRTIAGPHPSFVD